MIYTLAVISGSYVQLRELFKLTHAYQLKSDEEQAWTKSLCKVSVVTMAP